MRQEISNREVAAALIMKWRALVTSIPKFYHVYISMSYDGSFYF